MRGSCCGRGVEEIVPPLRTLVFSSVNRQHLRDSLYRSVDLRGGAHLPTNKYLRPAISNGHPVEQALIRRWWYENHNAQGLIVWEYCFKGTGCYADAVWFPSAGRRREERPGQEVSTRFPLQESPVVLCEAKLTLNCALLGQALLHTKLAQLAGAHVQETVVLAESGVLPRVEIAEKFGFTVVLKPLSKVIT
jgi:hypothetical protein